MGLDEEGGGGGYGPSGVGGSGGGCTSGALGKVGHAIGAAERICVVDGFCGGRQRGMGGRRSLLKEGSKDARTLNICTGADWNDTAGDLRDERGAGADTADVVRFTTSATKSAGYTILLLWKKC